jgi:hypothetical protein
MRFVVFVLCLLSTSAGAETRIYQTDAYGNKRYDLPSKVVKGDRIYEADPYGNVRYDKPGQVIKGNRIYETDPYGNVRYDKPSQTIESDDRHK